MAKYTLRIRPHYSGLFMGDCLEEPGFTVLGRDHDEVACLARQAFAGADMHTPTDHGLGASADEA
jgi:hypothetical protein